MAASDKNKNKKSSSPSGPTKPPPDEAAPGLGEGEELDEGFDLIDELFTDQGSEFADETTGVTALPDGLPASTEEEPAAAVAAAPAPSPAPTPAAAPPRERKMSLPSFDEDDVKMGTGPIVVPDSVRERRASQPAEVFRAAEPQPEPARDRKASAPAELFRAPEAPAEVSPAPRERRPTAPSELAEAPRERRATSPGDVQEPPPRERVATQPPPLPPPSRARSAPLDVGPSVPLSITNSQPVPTLDGGSELDDNQRFRQEAQRLGKARDWQKLAGLTSAAIDAAPWAQMPETKSTLLYDLARIYRDRLRDLDMAELTFQKLTALDAANEDAVEFLASRYQDRGDYKALFELYGAATEASWDPNRRLEWTQQAVQLAKTRLQSDEHAIAAWERLWKLGDGAEEAFHSLSQMYRKAGRWDRLGEFMEQRALDQHGTPRIVALREVAEAYLSGMRDHERADRVLGKILAERPRDIVALMGKARVLARRKAWDELEHLGTLELPDVSGEVALDLRRIVADALWSAGELDRSVEVRNQILAIAPDDPDSLEAKEEFLSKTNRTAELVQFLSGLAERKTSDEDKSKLLGRAAELAERDLDDPRLAIALWEKRALCQTGRLEAFVALVGLYDQLGDLAGVRRALEGQLAIVRQPAQRIELLRRLGEHCAHRMGDDARAEACWREVLGYVPDDGAIRDELVALYRRRGDFEALDRTLTGQALRAVDDGSIRNYWLQAAQNIDAHSTDAERGARAWARVLDLAPELGEAQAAMVQHRRAVGRPRELALALEELILQAGPEEQAERGLELARLWQEEGDRIAALGAFERVFRWRSTDTDTLSAIRALSQAGSSETAYEAAADALPRDDRKGRLAFLEQAGQLAESQDKQRRFWIGRRLLRLSGNESARLAGVVASAHEANLHLALAALYHDLIAESRDAAERVRLTRELGRHYEDKLRDPLRALLVHESLGRQPVDDETFADLSRLSEATGRYEELLALLDVQTRCEQPLATRQQALRRRAQLCERKLGDPERAFYECGRLLELDAEDAEALGNAERLAEQKQLWRPLDALYAELFLRADSVDRRVALLTKRAGVRAEHLKDAAGSLDQLLLAYRLAPEAGELAPKLSAAADQQKAWDRVLPLFEAEAMRGTPEPDRLRQLADLYEQKLNHRDRAFLLLGRAFLLRPSEDGQRDRLIALADATGRYELLALIFRLAAARTGDVEQRLDLLRRVATILGDRLQRKEEALDVHRRILQLQPTDLASLEVVIDHERQMGLHRELRDSLLAWSAVAPASDSRKIARLLEVATLSATQLGDAEKALQVYAEVLELDATCAEALAGVRSLTKGPMEPQLELRRLRIELQRTQGARRPDLLLAIARIEEEELDDDALAQKTLEQLCKEAGPAGPGYAPLLRILKRQKRYPEIVDRMVERAAVLAGQERIDALREAIELCESESVSMDRYANVCRLLAEALPDDERAQHRLLSVYRATGAHEERAALLRRLIARSTRGEAEARARRALLDELALLLDRVLSRVEESSALIKTERKAEPSDLGLLWTESAQRLRAGDFAGYLALREEEAKLLPPVLGALVLCHLAEACDERPGSEAKVPVYYRSARALDAANLPAIEALKAIGRRAKGWRSQAALLSDPDEAKLAWPDRAERLYQKAQTGDAATRQQLLLRAVAIDPEHFRAWEALAEQAAARGEHDEALKLRRWALAAWERSGQTTTNLEEHADRMMRLCEALKQADSVDEAEEVARRAHDLEPRHPGAALAVAELRLQGNDVAGAYALYDRVLRLGKPVPKDRLLATYRRGALAARLGKGEQAIADLREGLRIDPLHPGVLNALADALAERTRYAAAVQHYTQALLLADGPHARGELYGKTGRLWDDKLGNPDEAGICYDLAISGGLTELELMLRALRYYRHSGQHARALEVIDRLVPGTTDPAELAALWTERGAILASTDEDKAIEAFDMALSYDPGNANALSGLAEVLERRGDWAQLRDIFEARAENGAPADRAAAYRNLARISTEHLSDVAAAERYTKLAISLQPDREDYEQLLQLYGRDTSRFGDRREALAGLVQMGRPRLPRLVELGKMVAEQGDRRWSWCLLSPLLNATITDGAVKALVLELRKEFEKSDNLQAVSAATIQLVGQDPRFAKLAEAMRAIDDQVPLGPQNADALGAQSVSKLDARTAVGKTWVQVAERLGIEGALLLRAGELDAPFRLLDTDSLQAIVKSEFMQLMPASEIQFLFVLMVELGRSGARLTRALQPNELEEVMAVLLDPSRQSPIGEQLRGTLGIAELRRLGEGLGELGLDAAALATQYAESVYDAALRVALCAVPDLRAAARVITRLEEHLPKLQTSGSMEELDEFLDQVPALHRLVGFAVTSEYSALLG